VPTILVLEDDVSNRQAIGAILRFGGYKVVEATTGAEAIAQCKNRTEAIDLLVSDISLPDRSGTEIALEVVQSSPTMAVLLISGMPMDTWEGTDQSNFRRLQSRVVDFLEKPFRASTLGEKVRRLFDRLRPTFAGWKSTG
jgi:CheY-like chemotaxis protein